jgi:hypothetical protein
MKKLQFSKFVQLNDMIYFLKRFYELKGLVQEFWINKLDFLLRINSLLW